ncbi:hypothetical protein GH714_037428 [Hevea brasiliensis]|uniref:Pentacotripeptide-repeat region of PRORP domain-containing protein n=1 Tax=Hevea brasiliensis TaxID=3981 RepID=A0A6A6MMI4_HEVBR|nr:hypothetical protein GH714_037428 [Hevea brasiliensis]
MHNNSILPNNYTFPFLLKSLSDFKDFKQARSVHTHVVKFGHLNDIYVQNSLLNVYASCGHMGLCRQLFDEMPDKDVVSWTILIMGYRSAGNYDDALIAFEQMQYAGLVPNHVTMVNVLGACASFGAIEMGLDVFRSMKERNIFTWNAVIKGLAFAKCGQEAVLLLNRMEEEGLNPDEVTLVNVLSACSHAGMVDMGQRIFSSLINGKYGFSPNAKHIACMVDLFARAGHLDEAFKFIREMPFEPTIPMWGSLLAVCRAQRNLELSEFVAKKLVELEPGNSAYYVVLSTCTQRWEMDRCCTSKGINEGKGT